jgi:hypothetical protein
MRRPLSAIEIIVVIGTLSVVIWIVNRASKPVQPMRTSQGIRRVPPESAATTPHSDASRLEDAAGVPAESTAGSQSQSAVRKPLLPGETMPELPSLLEQILLESDPAVAALLLRGLELLKAGHYIEARSVFQAIMEEHPESGLRPVALWALALSHYREGGTGNLALSAGRFADFLARYGQFRPEILVEAAQVDLAVICMDLMKSDASERLKVEAATVAAASMAAFLDKWPSHPQAAAIRASLLQVQDFLSSMQKSRNGRVPQPAG